MQHGLGHATWAMAHGLCGHAAFFLTWVLSSNLVSQSAFADKSSHAAALRASLRHFTGQTTSSTSFSVFLYCILNERIRKIWNNMEPSSVISKLLSKTGSVQYCIQCSALLWPAFGQPIWKMLLEWPLRPRKVNRIPATAAANFIANKVL